MKNIILILLTICFIAGNARSQEKLTLNNGNKWKVDRPTAANVAALKTLIKQSIASPKLISYRQTGTELQKGINKMIRECRVKGADHQALHHWLEPLIEQVAALNKAKDVQNAAKNYEAVTNRLKLFDRYFQE